MSRTPASPETRIQRLLAARKKARPADVANADEMSRIVGMTWRNLKLTIDQDAELPVRKRGAEGVAWEFEVVAVLDHMIRRCRSAIASNASKARRMAQLAGVALPEDDGDRTISLNDLAMINRLQIDTQKRKMEQGDWVPREQVRSLFTAFFGAVQQEHHSAPATIDPAGKLPPDVRAALADHMRAMQVRLHDKFGAFIADDAGSSRPARARVRGAKSRGALRKRA